MTASPKKIVGLSEVFAAYEGFILDLWGVVHDGVKPYPGTIETLTNLKKAKRKIWLLSNAPRRAQIVAQKLTEMGIASALYDGVLTSGEASRNALSERYLQQWGRRMLHIGAVDRDCSVYEGLDVTRVQNPAEADFILNTGVFDFSDTVDQYEDLLQECAEKGLPMLCANPDKVVHVEEKLVICAGTIADRYEALEGSVVSFGKPYRGVYSAVLEAMGTRQVLAVGDSMLTDIAGATGAGIASLLVTSGIHREELANTNENHLQQFLAKYPYRPNYLVDGFKW